VFKETRTYKEIAYYSNMNSNFISNLQKKRCNYNHPDQATSQANSLILLSSGIYTEEERFVFELLQNAVDAHNTESEILDVKMIIKDGYFIFLHNGEAFTERDIEGLCDVGNGNKMKDVKKIGYKGIGFKSVFMRSTNVTVQSGGYCFKFDKSYWDNYWNEHWNDSEFGERDTEKKYLMPWQIIPIETTPPVLLNNSEFNVATFIKVNGTDSLEQKILKLLSSSQFLLFLMSKNIRMTFESKGETKCWIEKQERNKQVVLLTNGKEESRWLIHTNENVEVPPELKESINADINTPDKLKGVDTFDLSFAIALDDKGKLKRLEHAVVYTYLPTSFCFGSEGFPFLVNANFITDAGRQQLHKDSEWNKLIFSKIPAEYLAWIKEVSTVYKNYWEVLPEKTYGVGNPLEELYAVEMEKAINEIAFIPCLKDSSQKVLVSNAFMDRMGISDAISVKALVNHINRTYSHSFEEDEQIANIWKGSRILKNYGVFVFDEHKLIHLFEDNSIFVGITPEYDIKLIQYLFRYYSDNIEKKQELLGVFKQTKFLLDENENLALPNSLFFPSPYREKNKEAKDALFLNEEIANNINSSCASWLKIVGVQELNDISYIKDVICKNNYITKENAINVIRFLFKVHKKTNIFENIDSCYLSKLSFLTQKGQLKKPSELYLSKAYKPTNDISNYCSEDIFLSEEYIDNNSADEWKLFMLLLGIKDTIESSSITLDRTECSNYPLLKEAKEKFNKRKQISSNGNPFPCFLLTIDVTYIPLVLDNNSIELSKIIWTKILSSEMPLSEDMARGICDMYYVQHSEVVRLSKLVDSEFLPWAIKNYQKFPSSNGVLLRRNELYLNTNDIKELGGSYLPVIDVDCEIHDSWKDLLNLRNIITIDDCLEILTNVSRDKEKAEVNKERISKVYQRIVELDGFSDNNKSKIKMWASSNLILSKDNEFVVPSSLSHITLDGFSSKNRVYIGNSTNKERIVELLALMGVNVIQNVKAEYDDKKESKELKNILKGKISPLALLATGENAIETDYDDNKSKLSELINNTHFYHCEKIKLTYGNSNDVIEKHTFGDKNEFYYIGNLRPANIEPLLEPLCRYLGIKGKERELFIMFYENIDGIKQNLKDKGYDVSLIEEETVSDSGTFEPRLGGYNPDLSQQERNLITGFKGEIIVYEKLIALGYRPVCPSISTKDDYEKEVVVNGKTYYCKSNYNSECDISFETESGHQMLIEVKSTTTSVGYIENMPISSDEWKMIKECDKEQDKSYLIVRVFGVDSPKQDVYLFKSHLFE
jgi:hypothetical protein